MAALEGQWDLLIYVWLYEEDKRGGRDYKWENKSMASLGEKG